MSSGQSTRWTRQASPGSPWIPTSAVLSGHDNLAFASGNFADPHLMLVAVDGVDGATLAENRGVTGAGPVLQVAAGSRAGALYAIAQYPVDSPLMRRTEVTGYDFAPSGDRLDLRFQVDLELLTNGPALLACDALGRTVVAAAWDDVAGELQVDAFAGSDGELLFRRRFTASSLDHLAISGDGSTIAVRGGGELHVLDAAGASLLDAPLGSFSRALALSHDGSLLAVGAAVEVTLYRARSEPESGYDVEAHVTGQTAELPVCVAIAADGSSYAIGWWHAVSARTARFDWRDGESHASFFSLAQTTPSLQNLPVGIDLTADGQRAAFGTWGGADPSLPRVFLVERGASEPVATFQVPGSVQALDLDSSGTRLLVAAKDTHANQVGSTGALRLFDTEERDLALTGPARRGGRLEVEFEPTQPGAVLLVVGDPLPGAPLDGDALAVDRGRRHFLFPGLLDRDGIARWSLRIPDSPALSGRNFAVQGVMRGPVPTFSRPVTALILD